MSQEPVVQTAEQIASKLPETIANVIDVLSTKLGTPAEKILTEATRYVVVDGINDLVCGVLAGAGSVMCWNSARKMYTAFAKTLNDSRREGQNAGSIAACILLFLAAGILAVLVPVFFSGSLAKIFAPAGFLVMHFIK